MCCCWSRILCHLHMRMATYRVGHISDATMELLGQGACFAGRGSIHASLLCLLVTGVPAAPLCVGLLAALCRRWAETCGVVWGCEGDAWGG
jgi:hypothetical protein